MALRVAFIYSNDYTIHSVYIPSTGGDPLMMPPTQEPETPEGCFRMEIPETIVYTDAMKVVVAQDGTIELVPDEEKLTYLRNLALPHIRKTRNELLAMCDFRIMPDYVLPEETRQQWMAYRQALRDITNTQDVLNVTWPCMPGMEIIQPEPVVEPQPESQSEPVAESQPEYQPESQSEPVAESQPEYQPESQSEPVAEYQPEPSA